MPIRGTVWPRERSGDVVAGMPESVASPDARVRLAEEEREHDEAARTRLASSMVTRPIVDRRVKSEYLMSVRFNRLLDELDAVIGLSGRTILSCGCGAGIYEIAFAKRGAHVFAYDISSGMLDIARHNARVHEVDITWFRSDDYALGDQLAALEAPKFDLIFGASILHHLADPESFRHAVARAIGPRAVAAFIEPLATPVVEFARRSRLNRAREHQTAHERVWSKREYMAFLAPLFRSVTCRSPLNLFSGCHRVMAGRRWAVPMLSAARSLRCDSVLSRVPGMSLFAWHGVFIATEPNSNRLEQANGVPSATHDFGDTDETDADRRPTNATS